MNEFFLLNRPSHFLLREIKHGAWLQPIRECDEARGKITLTAVRVCILTHLHTCTSAMSIAEGGQLLQIYPVIMNVRL